MTRVSDTRGVQIKRAYDEPAASDGVRLLVDRLWPRGVSKERIKIDAWRKDLAPSAVLRKWFAHDPDKWAEFLKRYKAELRETGAWAALEDLAQRAKKERITLVYSARDPERNQAAALVSILAEITA
ncbi:MAG: DUF488 family protein [Planctomycetota bacterium]|nr:MAG: DUF488 family protein [Planctomycetota bacterium]